MELEFEEIDFICLLNRRIWGGVFKKIYVSLIWLEFFLKNI